MLFKILLGLYVVHEECLDSWEEELLALEGKISHGVSSAIERGRALGHVVFIGDGDEHSKTLIEEVERKRSIRASFLAIRKVGDGTDLGTIHGTTAIYRTPQSFIESLAAKSLIPHIEDLIRKLELVIGASRRGLKNQLKSFLFRRTPSQASDINAQLSGKNSENYRDDQIRELDSRSVEAAMREQSDLCMMIGDFETAISTLKLLSSDLKSDRLHFHYASCQECLGAAHILSNYSNADALGYFREAFYKYSHLADIKVEWKKSLSVMYSTRAALTIARLLISLGKFKEASSIVMKSHFQEDNLRAAVLLEYAAFLLKSNDPPKIRKHGFYVVLAALRYGQAGKYKLAAHSHQYVVSIYGKSGWDTIEEHVREALGKNCEESGRYQDAFIHYLSILECSNLPSQLQDLHLSQVQKLYDNHNSKLVSGRNSSMITICTVWVV
jgi:tetratricopeptide (TPR) repeat protein